MYLQAVNALDGTLLDDYTLTKPSNWSANSTVQTSFVSSYIGNFTATWAEQYGKKLTSALAVSLWFTLQLTALNVLLLICNRQNEMGEMHMIAV